MFTYANLPWFLFLKTNRQLPWSAIREAQEALFKFTNIFPPSPIKVRISTLFLLHTCVLIFRLKSCNNPGPEGEFNVSLDPEVPQVCLHWSGIKFSEDAFRKVHTAKLDPTSFVCEVNCLGIYFLHEPCIRWQIQLYLEFNRGLRDLTQRLVLIAWWPYRTGKRIPLVSNYLNQGCSPILLKKSLRRFRLIYWHRTN